VNTREAAAHSDAGTLAAAVISEPSELSVIDHIQYAVQIEWCERNSHIMQIALARRSRGKAR
jgi:hypothetical protein